MATDPGPLDWRVSIVDKQGRPSPEFQRRWNTNRNNTALIGTISFGSGTPTSTPSDGAEYVDVSTDPFTLYVGQNGTWHNISVTSANPIAIASDVAVDGSAVTFMRSDAAPAVQKATVSQYGLVKPDGSTITISNGIITSVGGGGGGGGSMLPLVTGDLTQPAPQFIVDASGQCIGVPL